MAQKPYWEYRKALRELDDKLTDSEQRVENVEKFIGKMQQSKYQDELSVVELSSLDGSRKTYRAVGRMFVIDTIPAIQTELKTRINSTGADIARMEMTKKELERLVEKDKANLRIAEEELLKSE